MSKNVAVVLSGCGFKDGSEIHEAVLTLLALDQQGAVYSCFAPDIEQSKVHDHYRNTDTDEKRNVLTESARIARGDIKPLAEFYATDFDAVIFPGGFGAALNLCSFAQDGADCIVNKDVEKTLVEMNRQGKAIGALCISPVLIAKVIENTTITIGKEPNVAAAITSMGSIHEITDHGQVVVDTDNKIVTTPCYMLDSSLAQVFAGVEKLVSELLNMA
ncbi:MAG: isoprenoid biosynthesis protein ElbB [Desulfobulbus propionicus]|nr:MAG: isoprenoid biosynthesis protein ElbB [Desulfobulbus propionicus]